MELAPQEARCDWREPAPTPLLKVIQVVTQRQARLRDMFLDYGPFEGRKPLIPGYMFVTVDQWPIADGVVRFVGLVTLTDLDTFAAAIRAERARQRRAGPLLAHIRDGAIEMFGRRLVLRGDRLVEQH